MSAVLPSIKDGTRRGSEDTKLASASRVVLIDPRPDRRAVMNFLVGRSPALTVVGLAGSLEEAERHIRDEHADVAVVEIQMPVPEGLATISALREAFPDLRIIVCSFHLDAATRDEAQQRGADGYLIKPISIRDLSALVV
ncbi:MAG: two-component system, NarL family, response regulator DesR [Acidimicrobiaceae bacterium]|nr:two-component system, NarL family, response regulator DesR [Acidimicrobiaceae bacterium]